MIIVFSGRFIVVASLRIEFTFVSEYVELLIFQILLFGW